jgi:hypothetical protein
MGQPTPAAPVRNLIGLLRIFFGFNSDEICEAEKNLTFIRLKYAGSEPTDNELSDIVVLILSLRPAGPDTRRGKN